MLQEALDCILELKILIVVSALGILFTGGLLLILSRSFTWNGRHAKIVGFLYELKLREILMISITLLKLFFVIAFIIGGFKAQMTPMVFFGGLFLVYAIVSADIRSLPLNFVNTVIMGATMVVMGMLSSYLQEVYKDWRIVVALILMSIFLVLYALCDIFRAVNVIIDKSERKKIAYRKSKE